MDVFSSSLVAKCKQALTQNKSLFKLACI